MPAMNMIQALNDAHKVMMRQDDDIRVGAHGDLVGVVERLDHVPLGH